MTVGWDYWDTFRLHEAACLIAGEPVIQKRVSKLGDIAHELPAGARPVFKRLLFAEAMGRKYRNGEQEHPDHPKAETLNVLPVGEADHELFVSREELHRWVQAIGRPSAYQFLRPERRGDAQSQTVDAETAPISAPSAAPVLWSPKELGRADDLRRALHGYLLLADKTAPPPKARAVLDAWSTDKPPRITRVHAGSVDYPANGPDGEKTAGIGQIQDRIDNLIQRLDTAQ